MYILIPVNDHIFVYIKQQQRRKSVSPQKAWPWHLHEKYYEMHLVDLAFQNVLPSHYITKKWWYTRQPLPSTLWLVFVIRFPLINPCFCLCKYVVEVMYIQKGRKERLMVKVGKTKNYLRAWSCCPGYKSRYVCSL